jgi:hypothetical protein
MSVDTRRADDALNGSTMPDATPTNPGNAAPGLQSGVVVFESTGETIGPALGCRAFAEFRVAKNGSLHVAGGHSQFELRDCALGGARFHVRIEYLWETLQRIDLMMLTDRDGTSWADWTYENEMARKRAHDAWAAAAIGRELTLKPYLMPEPVIPRNAGEDHPRHAVFPWGELISFHDSKGGASYLSLCYGVKPDPGA